MAVAGRRHGNAGGEIKKLVSVNVSHDDAASALRDHRIRTRIGRRNILLVALEHSLGVGPGQGRLDLGTVGQSFGGGHSLGSHWILRVWKGTTSVVPSMAGNDVGL